MFLYLIDNNYLIEYGFGLIITNIFIYLLMLIIIFSIFFFFNINHIQSLSDLKRVNTKSFFLIIIILSFLSLAGVPPLVGFVGKFLLLMIIIANNNFLLFIILGLVNMFILYFYIQNIRFIIVKNSINNNNVKNNYIFIDYSVLNTICTINLINLFGIFFFEDFLLIINFWSSFLFF